jgi:signal transduction histidine kinase
VAGGLVGGSLALPFSIAALTPIDDLVAGTREVAAGNLAARVPVTSTDEFADLVVSFNEMVEGLREREALRGHNAELVEELQASRARIVAASNEARRQVERDLHDGAQQNLVLLNLKLGQVERAVADDPAARSLVVDTRAELERALAELRDLAHGIYPQVLTSDGLSAALAEAAAGAPVLTDLDSDGTGRYPAELEAAVYFCCLEALQNAAKHAGEGTRATIRLSEQDGTLRFEVADNGCGFDVVSTNGSAGLQNMADRIGALGGELQVTSTLGHGTRVTGRVPVETVPGGGT